MLLMLKLLVMSTLLSSIVYANGSSEVEDFLSDKFSQNSQIKSVDINVNDVITIKELKGWSAYVVTLNAVLNDKKKSKIKQKMVWFSNGDVITKELTDMQTGESYADLVKPQFKKAYYKKENLIYGSENARHKIAIFSDPLCPFCSKYVPNAIKEMKKDPKRYAIYYYHYPLTRIHPASDVLVRAAVAAELQGVKDVALKFYNVKVKTKEKDINVILKAFNKAVGSNVKKEDLNNKKVMNHINFDLEMADTLMVAGTPTIYVDGKQDKTKQKYKKVK